MQRSREFKLLSLVSLYLLLGLSLTNIGLSSVNHAEPVWPLMADGFMVWLFFTVALLLLHLYLSRRLKFSGDQLILPLIAILCATSLILISYLEPTRLQSAVDEYKAYSPQKDTIKLYTPTSYIEVGEYQKMVDSWNKVTARNTAVLTQNKAYCDALKSNEYDWERCPVTIAAPDWHWYLYQQLGTILVGFVTIALFLRKPKREWRTIKLFGLTWPDPRNHFPEIARALIALILTVIAYLGINKDTSILLFFSRTQLLGLALMAFAVVPLFRERWLELSGIQAFLLFLTGVLLILVLLPHLIPPIWMAEWVRVMLIVFFASVGARFINRLHYSRAIYWRIFPYLLFVAVLVLAVIGMLLLNDFGAVLIFTFISFSFIILLLPSKDKIFTLIAMLFGLAVSGFIAYGGVLPALRSDKICDRVNFWLQPDQKPREGDKCQPMVRSLFDDQVTQGQPTPILATNVQTETGQISPTLALTSSLTTAKKEPLEPAGTYQIRQMIRATWYGTVTGQGLGQGRSGFIPAAETDLMFAVLIEQMGWIGGLLIVAVYVAIVWRGFMIAQQKIDNPRHALLAAGLAALLGFHALTIIGGTVLVLPFTGITVPFLSRGNLSMILSFITIGLLLRVSEGASLKAPIIAPPNGWHNPDDRLLSNIRTLRVVVLAAFFIVVIVGMARISIIGPVMASIHSDDNRWANAADQYIQRGAILDRDGKPIVVSTEVGSRVYPDPLLAESLAPLIGHDADYAPTLGIEYFYNNILKGYDAGSALSELLWHIRVNALHQVKGNDVKTTISAPLQKAVYQIMIDQAYVQGPGAAIVIDSHTGEVLADVSVPSFDVVNFTHFTIQDKDPTEPFLNRALQGTYPPGSVFKLVTIAAALDTPTKQPDGKIYSPQLGFNFKLVSRNNSWWHDGNCPGVTTESPQGYGRFNLSEALAFSDNVVFAQMGQDVPVVLYENYLKRFGLTTTTVSGTTSQPYAIGVPSAASTYGPEGFLNNPCNRAVTAFGQGDLQLTPLQVALIGATIANDGKMPYPKLITEPAVHGGADVQVMKPETAKEIKQMMLLVVNHSDGSGFNARFCTAGVGRACKDTWTHNDAPGFTGPIQIAPAIAGKTGTAQNDAQSEDTAWFVGFSTDNPRYVVAVVLDHQGKGFSKAAPVAREILRAALNLPGQ